MPAPAARKKKDFRQRKEATEVGQSFGSEQAGGEERRRKIKRNSEASNSENEAKRRTEHHHDGRTEQRRRAKPWTKRCFRSKDQRSCCREEGVFRSTTKIAAGKPWGAFNIMFIIIWT